MVQQKLIYNNVLQLHLHQCHCSWILLTLAICFCTAPWFGLWSERNKLFAVCEGGLAMSFKALWIFYLLNLKLLTRKH